MLSINTSMDGACFPSADCAFAAKQHNEDSNAKAAATTVVPRTTISTLQRFSNRLM